MISCTRCGGEGYEEYEEDPGRWVRDPCYHCGTSGLIDEQAYFEDRLHNVANSLAHNYILEMKRAINSDPDGDGWDLYAAENMLSSSDYFMARVWEKSDEYMELLMSMPVQDQEFLIAWNEYPFDPPIKAEKKEEPRYIPDAIEDINDNIPF